MHLKLSKSDLVTCVHLLKKTFLENFTSSRKGCSWKSCATCPGKLNFQFALVNIYVGSADTTIQGECNTLMQHIQQTTFKSTIQIFEYCLSATNP